MMSLVRFAPIRARWIRIVPETGSTGSTDVHRMAATPTQKRRTVKIVESLTPTTATTPKRRTSAASVSTATSNSSTTWKTRVRADFASPTIARRASARPSGFVRTGLLDFVVAAAVVVVAVGGDGLQVELESVAVQ